MIKIDLSVFLGAPNERFLRRDALVRSHEGDAVLHRVDHDKEGILGGVVRESVLLPDRMVQSKERGVHLDGRGLSSYVSTMSFPFVLL